MKSFLSVTKPGIIVGNLITVTAGFFLATKQQFDFALYLATLVGISLIIASGCVFNNYIDRDIDQLMERTKNRLSALGIISGSKLIALALFCGVLGALCLYGFANPLTMFVALIGLFFYVVVYSLWSKRNTVYGTLIGSISGAIPPVVGYCAVANQLDLAALLLFVILCCWQMPHSYAIGIFRLNDYTAAKIPVMPVKQGVKKTKISMMAYIFVFTAVVISPTLFGYAGPIYGVVAFTLGAMWFVIGIKNYHQLNDAQWAKRMFLFSLIVITVWSFFLMLKY